VPPQNTSSLIRVGIWALPLAGLLSSIGALASFGSPDPFADPEGAAQSLSTTGYQLSQFVGNVLAVTVVIFGVIALFGYLANNGWWRLGAGAMTLCILGLGMLESFLGIVTYALPALSRAYLGGQHDAFTVGGFLFSGPLILLVNVSSLLYFLGFLLFSVAIWRSGVLPRGAAVLLAIAVLFLAAPVNVPFLTIVGSALLLIAGGWIALGVMRAPSGPSGAEAQPRVR
jgi:hypothetical protein